MIYEQTSLQKQRDIDRNKTETLFGVLVHQTTFQFYSCLYLSVFAKKYF